MTILSKCGKYSVTIRQNGTGGSFFTVAEFETPDHANMTNSSYWFTIGRYKSEKIAIRQAIKKMASYNIELVV